MSNYYRSFSPSPGRMLQNAAGGMWSQLLLYYPDPVSFELTTYLGYRAIRTICETGAGEDVIESVYTGAASDEACPARLLLQDAGAEIQFYSNYRTGFPPETFLEVKEAFTENVVPLIVAAIDWMTNGSVGTTTSHEISSMGGQFGHSVTVIPVFTDTEVLCWQVSVYGLGNATGFDYQDLNGAGLPAPKVGSVDQGQAAVLAGIAKAVTTMATTTRVAWINNEGGFADLVSGDVVTPP